jgi:hypothetical protein
LSKVGRLSYLNETLADFRWHPDSLSVRRRADSVREASVVRRSHLPIWVAAGRGFVGDAGPLRDPARPLAWCATD